MRGLVTSSEKVHVRCTCSLLQLVSQVHCDGEIGPVVRGGEEQCGESSVTGSYHPLHPGGGQKKHVIAIIYTFILTRYFLLLGLSE